MQAASVIDTLKLRTESSGLESGLWLGMYNDTYVEFREYQSSISTGGTYRLENTFVACRTTSGAQGPAQVLPAVSNPSTTNTQVLIALLLSGVIRSSQCVCFIAEVCVTSPRKLFVSIISKIFSGSKCPTNYYLILKTEALVAQYLFLDRVRFLNPASRVSDFASDVQPACYLGSFDR